MRWILPALEVPRVTAAADDDLAAEEDGADKAQADEVKPLSPELESHLRARRQRSRGASSNVLPTGKKKGFFIFRRPHIIGHTRFFFSMLINRIHRITKFWGSFSSFQQVFWIDYHHAWAHFDPKNYRRWCYTCSMCPAVADLVCGSC